MVETFNTDVISNAVNDWRVQKAETNCAMPCNFRLLCIALTMEWETTVLLLCAVCEQFVLLDVFQLIPQILYLLKAEAFIIYWIAVVFVYQC